MTGLGRWVVNELSVVSRVRDFANEASAAMSGGVKYSKIGERTVKEVITVQRVEAYGSPRRQTWQFRS